MSTRSFSPKTIELLMYQSALICSRPECGVLTVGPVDAHGALANKKGEAAHICAEKSTSARFDKDMSDSACSDASNAIWLCASCHTMIDKSSSQSEFTAEVLRDWKKRHLEVIRQLYMTARSPLPLLRMMADDGKLAQEACDVFENHGVFVVEMDLECITHVVDSIKHFRFEMAKLARQVSVDTPLKQILMKFSSQARDAMNETSANINSWTSELATFRSRTSKHLRRLVKGWNCTPGPLVSSLLQIAGS